MAVDRGQEKMIKALEDNGRAMVQLSKAITHIRIREIEENTRVVKALTKILEDINRKLSSSDLLDSNDEKALSTDED